MDSLTDVNRILWNDKNKQFICVYIVENNL